MTLPLIDKNRLRILAMKAGIPAEDFDKIDQERIDQLVGDSFLTMVSLVGLFTEYGLLQKNEGVAQVGRLIQRVLEENVALRQQVQDDTDRCFRCRWFLAGQTAH